MKRYDTLGVGRKESDDGDCVLYTDHKAEVDRLRQALEKIVDTAKTVDVYDCGDIAEEALNG